MLAESYERIHRSNLVGMGILPLQYLQGQTAETIGVTGKERFTVCLPTEIQPGQNITIKVSTGASFEVKVRFDTDVELVYYRNGGILNYMIRKILS